MGHSSKSPELWFAKLIRRDDQHHLLQYGMRLIHTDKTTPIDRQHDILSGLIHFLCLSGVSLDTPPKPRDGDTCWVALAHLHPGSTMHITANETAQVTLPQLNLVREFAVGANTRAIYDLIKLLRAVKEQRATAHRRRVEHRRQAALELATGRPRPDDLPPSPEPPSLEELTAESPEPPEGESGDESDDEYVPSTSPSSEDAMEVDSEAESDAGSDSGAETGSDASFEFVAEKHGPDAEEAVAQAVRTITIEDRKL